MKRIYIIMMLISAAMCWQAPSNAAEKNADSSSVSAEQSVAQASKINLNTANWQELTKLPGVGEKKAKAIIAYRDVVGEFVAIDQLTEVKGIGDKMLKKISPALTLK